MRFYSHLADRLHHTSIKVNLSGIRSLHIDMGFSDLLVNCLQLQRVLRGIKQHQGSHKSPRQPITGDLMRVIHSVLSLSDYSQAMLWAACCLGFFGFLRAGEFTVNKPFDLAIHLTPQDLQLDSPLPFPFFHCLSQCDRCLDDCVWGLMAGLWGLPAMEAFHCLGAG